MVDFVAHWSNLTELPLTDFVTWLGVARSKFYEWRDRYGKANEHNGSIPRDHWILD